MKKAIFCDFYGTLVHENGPISLEVVGRVAESCGAAPEDVVAFWWERFGALSARCCGVDFRTRYDIAVESFQETVERFGSPEDPRALTDRMVEHWCAPPLYEDARAFLEAAPAPVYLVTNSEMICQFLLGYFETTAEKMVFVMEAYEWFCAEYDTVCSAAAFRRYFEGRSIKILVHLRYESIALNG